MALTVGELLRLEILSAVRPVAGREGLDRAVRWVHIWPETLPWLHGGELLLTTGYSWPGDARQQRRIVRDLDRAGLAAILFATGPYFSRIPRAILQAADEVRLPVLEAPAEIAFAEVTEVVNREIIRAQYEVLERSEQIHRQLTAVALEAADLSDICRALSQLIGRPVAILNPGLRCLASAPAEVGPQLEERWREAEGADRSGHRAFLDTLAQSRGPLRLRGNRRAWRDGIVCPIRVGGELAGSLWILPGAEAFTDLDLRAAEHGAVVAALHILRQRTVASVEARVQNSFVQALLRGEVEVQTGLEERARLLGFDPRGRYAVGLLALLGPGGRRRVLNGPGEFHLRERLDQALRQSLHELKLPALLGYVMNQVVFLLPAPADRLSVRALATSVWERVRAHEPSIPCALALGSAVMGTAGIAASYREADSALAVSEGEGVFWYEDFLVVRLLRSVTDPWVLRDLLDQTLGRLERVRQGAALRETVRALAAHAFNQRAAARALGVHWNTMRHRVARVETLLGRPLSDARVRVALELALDVERLGLPTDPGLPTRDARPAPRAWAASGGSRTYAR